MRSVPLTICLCLSVLQSGCMVEMSRTDPWRDWATKVGYQIEGEQDESFKKKSNRAYSPASLGYTIILKSFEGGDRYIKAQALMDKVNHLTGSQSAWIQENEDYHSVYRGRYFSIDDPQAEIELAQTRRLIMGGRRPFKDAQLVEIGSIEPKDAWDLRNHPGMYTLQVGFYTKEFGKKYRQKAEQIVKALRDQSFDAYYYHGPNMSLVTIGIYGDDKAFNIVRGQPVLNPEIRELQKQFPHNTKNGEPFIDPRSKSTSFATSFLANVPEI